MPQFIISNLKDGFTTNALKLNVEKKSFKSSLTTLCFMRNSCIFAEFKTCLISFMMGLDVANTNLFSCQAFNAWPGAPLLFSIPLTKILVSRTTLINY